MVSQTRSLWSVKNNHFGQSKPVTMVKQKHSPWSIKNSYYDQSNTVTWFRNDWRSSNCRMIKSRSETCGSHCPSESVRVTIFCQCLVVVFIMSLLKNASILPPCIIILTPSSFRPVVKIIFGIKRLVICMIWNRKENLLEITA